MLLGTGRTGPKKDQIMPVHLVAAALLGGLVQAAVIGQVLHIVDPAARLTAEMGVGMGAGIVPLHRERHPDDDPLLCQQIQIPVDRPQAQIGIFRLEPLVEHLRCGVLVCLHQLLVDQLSLPGISLAGHGSPPHYQE